jgi:sec-independent protein translocase protein TatC
MRTIDVEIAITYDVCVKEKGEMPLIHHLVELRKRIIFSFFALLIASIASYVFYDKLLFFLLNPFREIPTLSESKEILFVNSLFEGFIVRIKIAVLSGLIISFPIHVYNIVRFLLPGLILKEKRILLYSLVSSFALIIFGFYYGYYKVIPISISFLSSSGFIPKNVGLLLNYGRNIFFIFQFLLITVAMFQIPIVLEALMILNLLSRKALFKASRFVIVGIFVLAAVLTPDPSFITQLSIAVPLTMLFFITLLIAKIFNFGNR